MTNKNTDPKFILIERRHFDALLGQARVGDGEVLRDNATDKAVANVRQLNPHYDAEAAAEEAVERAISEGARQRAAEFVARYRGKEVWLVHSHGYGPANGWRGAMVKTCVVVGVADEKLHGAGVVTCNVEAERPGHPIYVGNLAAKEDLPTPEQMTDDYYGPQGYYRVPL